MKLKTTSSINARRSKKAATQPTRSRKSPEQRSRITVIIALGIMATTFLVYANSLRNAFVFDDQDLVVQNRLVRSVSSVPKVLVSSYRPLRDVSYILDFAIWGERPFGFHLTNVAIHMTNTLLVFILVRRLANDTAAATLAALIFAVHPIQTDAVSYISGRRDVLFTLFYLASFYCYLTYRSSRSSIRFLLFLLFWGLSLMSKEMAASMPLVIFLWNVCDTWAEQSGRWWERLGKSIRRSLARDKWLYIGLSLGGAAYAAIMVFVRRASIRASAAGFDYWGGSLLSSLMTVVRVHAWYLKQLVYPTPIAQYFGAFEISHSLLEWRVVGSLALLMALIAIALLVVDRQKLIAFAVLSYFALLMPVSQIIPHHELLADHYLYLPMMSFGLLVSMVVRLISFRGAVARRIAYGLCAVAVITLAVRTVLRNRDWKDELAVWQANYEAVPNSPRAGFNLAAQYLGKNPRKAEELFRRALDIDPTYAPTYTNLAQLYLSQNRFKDCEELVQKGLALPDAKIKSFITRDPLKFRSQLLTALAVAKGKQGDQVKGEQLLMQAINVYGANLEPYAILGSIYHDKDRAKEIEILKKGVAANPFVYEILERLTFLLVEDHSYDDALPYLEQMLRLVPSDFYANYQLGQIYRTKNDCRNASTHLAAARSAASKSEEIRVAQDAIKRLEQSCGKQ